MAVLTFGIPLRPRAPGVDFAQVETLLAATLASAFGQRDARVQVVIAATGGIALPPWAAAARILDVPAGEGSSYEGRLKDVTRRRKAIFEAVEKRPGDFLMFLDADDLVSARLAGEVLRLPPRAGYLLEAGYVMDEATGRVMAVPSRLLGGAPFHRLCGSSLVFGFAPLAPGGTGYFVRDLLTRGFTGRHDGFARLVDSLGLDYGRITWPAAIYRHATGINLSASEGSPWREIYGRALARIAREGSRLPPDLAAEFGLDGALASGAPRTPEAGP